MPASRKSQTAQSTPFDNTGTDLQADNVRDAILEAQTSLTGKLGDFSFVKTGSTYDAWLEFETSSGPSNEVPQPAAFNAKIIGLTYTNTNNETNIDCEIYINGNLFYTWIIRGYRTAYKTNVPQSLGFLAGDRISVFFRQEPGGTPGAQRPNKPVLGIYYSIDTTILGEGGTTSGV